MDELTDFLLAGPAKSGEICNMRPCDITFGMDGVWRYTPESHKTEHHNKQRRIHIGPKAQKILRPFLDRTRLTNAGETEGLSLLNDLASQEDVFSASSFLAAYTALKAATFDPEAVTGRKVISGGRRGSQATHGNPGVIHETYREKFREIRQQHPNETRTQIRHRVAKALNRSVRSVTKHTKDLE